MDIIIRKIVVEARYTFLLQLPEKMFTFLQSRVQDFSKVSVDGKSGISLASDTKSLQFFCDQRHAGVAIENVCDPSFLRSEIEILEKLLTHVEIGKISRLGVREWFLIPVADKQYEEAIRIYLGDQTNLSNLMLEGSDLTDFALVLEGKRGPQGLRVETGVVKRREFQTRYAEFVSDSDPDVAIMNDVDSFLSDIPTTQLARSVNQMLEQNRKLVVEFSGKIDGKFRSR